MLASKLRFVQDASTIHPFVPKVVLIYKSFGHLVMVKMNNTLPLISHDSLLVCAHKESDLVCDAFQRHYDDEGNAFQETSNSTPRSHELLFKLQINVTCHCFALDVIKKDNF